MKSEHITPTNTSDNGLKFPILAEYIGGFSKFIILFDTMKSGTVVWSENKERALGEYDTSFIDLTDESFWRILDKDEKIVLSN